MAVALGLAVGSATGGGRGAIVLPAGRGGTVAALGGSAWLSTAPQCTQNLALGWFSLPHAPHFITSVSCSDSRQADGCCWKRAAITPTYYGSIATRLSLGR